MYMLREYQKENKQKGKKKEVFETISTKNLPKLMSDITPQPEKAQEDIKLDK